MIVFFAGLEVWVALLLAGRLAGAPLIIGFFASLPFGATAFASLTSLGGSSPLIYTLFAIAILIAVLLRRTLLSDLGRAFIHFPTAWIAVALGAYAVAGSYILPRLFAGQTTAFVPIEGVVTEIPLAPASGNITQPAYFLLGILLFLALCVLLLRGDTLEKMRRGFFAFVIAHVLLGWIDFAGKLTGAGDLIEPIRTATYALLTDVEQSGFWRIVGGCSEASSFAAFGLAALGFAFTYWRETGSRLAFALTTAMLVLLLMSTSSTAYVGLAGMAGLAMLSIGRAALTDRMKPQDFMLMAGAAALLGLMLGLYLCNPKTFQPFVDLIQAMVFDKATSSSGQERSYWNMRSLAAFIDTYGLGLGLGSSRSSSWAVSVVSQLGVIGTAMIAVLLGILLRGMGGLRPRPHERPVFALCAGARACAVGYLLAGTIAGGAADPGVLFFASLATVLGCRHYVRQIRRAAGDSGSLRAVHHALQTQDAPSLALHRP